MAGHHARGLSWCGHPSYRATHPPTFPTPITPFTPVTPFAPFAPFTPNSTTHPLLMLTQQNHPN